MLRCGSQIARREEPVLRLHRDGRGVQVNHGGLHEGVAELLFDSEDVRAADQHVRGERMPEQVGPDALGNARPFGHDTHKLRRSCVP